MHVYVASTTFTEEKLCHHLESSQLGLVPKFTFCVLDTGICKERAGNIST